MSSERTIFEVFGGIRPMARALQEAPSNVAAWKRVGRIPAEKQPHVLEVGLAMGLSITAENLVFPLGRPDAGTGDGLAAGASAVACDRKHGLQRKGDGQ